MRRNRHWKLSEGGGLVFVGFLLLRLTLLFALVAWTRGLASWSSWLLSGLAFLCIWAFRALVWKNLRASSRWRVPRSWYEGAFAFACLLLAYAAVVFAFGITPSRYDHRPIPRAFGWHYVYEALVPMTVGLVALMSAKAKPPHPSPKTPSH
ncbi:MAG: hypothetical protein ABI222_09345 [Opitutaceae bacterium]